MPDAEELKLYLRISQILLGVVAIIVCIISPFWRGTAFIIFVDNYIVNFALLPFFEEQQLIQTSFSPFIYCLSNLSCIYFLHKWALICKKNEDTDLYKFIGSRGWFSMFVVIVPFIFVNLVAGINIITYDAHHEVTIFWTYYVPIIIGLNLVQSIILSGGIISGFQFNVGHHDGFIRKNLGFSSMGTFSTNNRHSDMVRPVDIHMCKSKMGREH